MFAWPGLHDPSVLVLVHARISTCDLVRFSRTMWQKQDITFLITGDTSGVALVFHGEGAVFGVMRLPAQRQRTQRNPYVRWCNGMALVCMLLVACTWGARLSLAPSHSPGSTKWTCWCSTLAFHGEGAAVAKIAGCVLLDSNSCLRSVEDSLLQCLQSCTLLQDYVVEAGRYAFDCWRHIWFWDSRCNCVLTYLWQ